MDCVDGAMGSINAVQRFILPPLKPFSRCKVLAVRHSVFFAFIVVMGMMCIAVGCGDGKSSFVAQSKGLPYELLVVIDKDLWNSASGDSLQALLNSDVPCLPQKEPLFKVSHVSPKGFGKLFLSVRNILQVKVSPQLSAARMGVERNVYASPQLVLTLEVPDAASLGRFLQQHGNHLTQLVVEEEMEREAAQCSQNRSTKVDSAVWKMLGVKVAVPSSLKHVKQGKQFLWASTNTCDKDMNFCIYAYPWVEGDAPFTLEQFLQKRDSVMQVNIPGGRPDQYMATEHELCVEHMRTTHGHAVMEVRGLWQMENDAMGGPYVSWVQVDSVHRRVLVTEAFVYAPGYDKRQLMRKIEASLRTLKY